MPRSEFLAAKLIDDRALFVSGTVTLDEGEAAPQERMRVVWVVRQGWLFAGGMNFVGEDLTWSDQTDQITSLWWASKELPTMVEATGTLIVERDERAAAPGGPSVAHPDAFVWTQWIELHPSSR
ncbi:MAG TPA: hypothetical protein VN213_09770 [Solirubrobacteraceae bacterium]|nr:hypothetical protein [Solirubrobacteraceae bacterium]